MTADITVNSPTFLVGSERSGTTLLRLMIDHHPEIAFMSEFEYIVDHISDNIDEPLPDLDDFKKKLKTDFIYSQNPFVVRTGLKYEQVAEDFLAQKRGAKRFVGATVHRHFDRLLRIWPDAKFVHLLRDPRDVSRSVVQMGWAGNVWIGAQHWIEAEKLWDKVRDLVPIERRIEIKYEDLIRQPEAVLTQIASFIGTQYHPDMMKYPEHSTYDLPIPSLIEQWKRQLKPSDVRLVEARVGNMLNERSYMPSGQPRITVTGIMVLRLKLQNKLFRIRFAQRRYGLILWAASALMRRLKISFIDEVVQRKMNVVGLQYLK